MADPKTILANQVVLVDALIFDTVESIRVVTASDVTEHPVEMGSSPADHVQKRGDVLVIRGIVSATQIVPTGAGAPRELAIAWFERNRTNLIQATTPLGIFRDLLLLGAPYSYGGTAKLAFEVQLKSVRLVTPVGVALPPRVPNPAVAAGASDAASMGSQATTPPATPPPASFLATALGLAG